MQISALEVWHVNNEENNSQMCSLESGSADENIETMKAYMCKQRGMHLGSKISREEITKKVNQSKYEKYCYITNRLRREQFPLGLFKYSSKIENSLIYVLRSIASFGGFFLYSHSFSLSCSFQYLISSLSSSLN